MLFTQTTESDIKCILAKIVQYAFITFIYSFIEESVFQEVGFIKHTFLYAADSFSGSFAALHPHLILTLLH